MANELQGVRVAFVVANEGIEEAELLGPDGPWTLIEGDLVAGRTLTSWPSLQTDLRNAGAGSRVDLRAVVRRAHGGLRPGLVRLCAGDR